MNCPKCTVPLMAGARFCGSCGLVLETPAQPAGQAPPTQPPPYQSSAPPQGGAFNFDADGRGQGRGYTWEIKHPGAFALAVIHLQPEQTIAAEAGAMVSMSANVDLHAEMKGGVFGALKRAVGGESAFVSTFTARGGPGEVTLAPGSPGDISGIEMQNQVFMVQSSSYLAGDTSLTVETKFGGAKSFFGGEGLHSFAFAFLVGIITGTYSSIYIAAPVVLWMSGVSAGVAKEEVPPANVRGMQPVR